MSQSSVLPERGPPGPHQARPHPEERSAGPRLEGWEPVLLLPILRDAALRAAPQDEVGAGPDVHFRGRENMASVKMPTAAELAKVGSELGMNLSDADIAFFQETFAGNVAAYALL